MDENPTPHGPSLDLADPPTQANTRPTPDPVPAPAGGDEGKPGRFARIWDWWKNSSRFTKVTVTLFVLVCAVFVVSNVWASQNGPDQVTLTEVSSQISDGNVTEAVITPAQGSQTGLVVVTLDDGTTQQATFPEAYGADLTTLLLDAGVDTNTQDPPPAWVTLVQLFLIQLLPLVIIITIIFILLAGSGRVTGQNTALHEPAEIPETRFTDVAGCPEAVADMTEMVEFVKDGGKRFATVGGKPPSGALLVGPPGTGKTLLARAVAGEAGVPFYALSGSDFVELFVGLGPRRIRRVFREARKNEDGAIIFIDEIDVIGQARSSRAVSGGDSEVQNTLTALLTELDGFRQDGVIILAATNRADVLDPALTRPGRLDRRVDVPLPDRDGRASILSTHAKSRPFTPDMDWTVTARQVPGMSGAELAQVVNEAALTAGREGSTTITPTHVHAAIHTVAMGRARTSAYVSERDRNITAWHEAGHTVAALVLDHADDPASVTVIPRGGSGGATWMEGSDHEYLTRSQATARLTVALAGRAGEEVLLDGDYTQGAHGDLTSATDLAMNMVTRFGMTGAGNAIIPESTMLAGGPVALGAHEQVQRLLADAHRNAQAVMDGHAELLARVAAELLDRETLTKTDLDRIRDEVENTLGQSRGGLTVVDRGTGSADTGQVAAATRTVERSAG